MPVGKATSFVSNCPLAQCGGGKPLSGDETGPSFKMESDLATLKIWPRVECKMNCGTFTTHQTASAFTQKKCSGWIFRNIAVVKSVTPVIAVPSMGFILVSCLPMPMFKCTSVQKDVDNSSLYRKINAPK